MNGPEHYLEAERLLEQASDCTSYDEAAGITAQAQVHATLAQTAALAQIRTPDVDGPESLTERDYRGWGKAVDDQ